MVLVIMTAYEGASFSDHYKLYFSIICSRNLENVCFRDSKVDDDIDILVLMVTTDE